MTESEPRAEPESEPETQAESASASASASESRRSRWGRPLLWTAVAVVLIPGPLLARVAWEGGAELERADVAREREDADAEIEHLGRAARWRAPVLSHDERALDRLEALGEAAEATGEDERHVALAAYREIRRALLATRAFGVAHPERLDRANAAIARLMAAQERAFGTDVSGRQEDPETFHRSLLDRDRGPVPWRANLAALSFVGWVVASGGFVLRGLDGEGRLRPRPALRWGGASVLLLLAWSVLLALVR